MCDELHYSDAYFEVLRETLLVLRLLLRALLPATVSLRRLALQVHAGVDERVQRGVQLVVQVLRIRRGCVEQQIIQRLELSCITHMHEETKLDQQQN